VSDSPSMDLRFTPEQDRFRTEVRSWLEANAPSASRGTGPLPSLDTAAGFEAHRAWERTLYDARWSVVSWPEEYGGRGAGLIEWLIFEEEYYRAGAPTRVGQNGIFLLAPTLFEFGTPAQKARYLPAMASGVRSGVKAGPSPTPAATSPPSAAAPLPTEPAMVVGC